MRCRVRIRIGVCVSVACIPRKHKTFCIAFVQCWTNVEDVVSTLYKCYKKVLCLLGFSFAFDVERDVERVYYICGVISN